MLAEQWELRKRIGVGGMGEVYAATCLADRLPYAVKVLSREHAADPIMVARFKHEYMVLRRVQHPNIIAAHAFFQVDGEFFYSMELLEGESLHAMIEGGPLPIDRALRLSLQLCDAVMALHALGVVHRDLKPSNVFVTQVDGREHLTLLDLGVCKLTPLWYANLEMRTRPGQRIQTREGLVVGTDGYIGPTDDRGDLESEVLRDVFGLGATLFRVIVGRLPHKRSPPEADDVPEWRPQDEARIPRDLAEVLSTAVAADPSRRYRTIASLRDDLKQVAEELGVIAATDGPDEKEPEPSQELATDPLADVPGPDEKEKEKEKEEKEPKPPGPGESEPDSSPGLTAASAQQSRPRASAGWILAMLLGIYVVTDLVGHLRGTDDNAVRGAQAGLTVDPADPASSQGVIQRQLAEPGPASLSPALSTGLDDVGPDAGARDAPSEFIPNPDEQPPEQPSSPPSSRIAANTQAAALGSGSPSSAAATRAPAPSDRAAPRSDPKPQPLSRAAFRRALASQRAALDLCISHSPPIVVRVSLAADGEVTGIDTGDASSLVSLCLRDVLSSIDFPRAGAASRHRLRLGGAP